TWAEALNFIEKLDLPGLKTGLTKFQTAVNLVFSHIIEPPTIDDIAVWMFTHKGFGSYRGLQKCGFALDTLDSVTAALLIVQDHMEQLTDDDKELLYPGPIFIEHCLCKIARWTKNLP
ncbi:hypothetical protein FA95DRAFT_1471579, partial [Auriscalpium vulgare]